MGERIKIIKVDCCSNCPNQRWIGNKRVCDLSTKIIWEGGKGVVVGDLPEWCELEDYKTK